MADETLPDATEKITYTINVNDLIEVLKEHKYAKIEFYKDGDFTIMDEVSAGYPNEAIHIEHYDLYDFEDCNSNIDEYTNWLESVWFNGLDIERYEEFENTAYVDYTIYINWVKQLNKKLAKNKLIRKLK